LSTTVLQLEAMQEMRWTCFLYWLTMSLSMLKSEDENPVDRILDSICDWLKVGIQAAVLDDPVGP
jgi:hypothetical protein